jgi:hypothetical protein
MTLVLINGCLEPGADGVGDYSRRLAAAFITLGLPTSLLALNDPHVASPLLGQQTSDGCTIPILRLPASHSWSSRRLSALAQLQAWKCSSLSLQFVPYAFDPRGIPLQLLDFLRHLGLQPGWRTHVMFHEIWIGVARSSDLRSRAIGHLQRRLIKAIWQSLRPKQTHTTNGSYACCLGRIGIDAARLPLFSGLEPVVTDSPLKDFESSPNYSACLFGRIPPRWDPDPAMAALVDEAVQQGRQARLLLIGRHWMPSSWIEQLRERWPQILIEQHGVEPDPHQLSDLIMGCQLGLAPVPWGLVEKSSAVAAFLTLGLPVVASNEAWQLRDRWRGNHDPDLPNFSNLSRLSAWRQRRNFAVLPHYQPMTPQRVAEAMWPALAP